MGCCDHHFLTQLLWVFGLHEPPSHRVFGAPFAITYAAENAAAVAAGVAPEHIFTYGFYFGFLQVSGSGMTLLLVIMMCRSKAKSLSSIGKVGIIPSFFGINEPIIFGLPVIMNPFMLIPFVLGPVIVSVISYEAMATGLVSLPIGRSTRFLASGIPGILVDDGLESCRFGYLQCLSNGIVHTIHSLKRWKQMNYVKKKKQKQKS